MLRKLEKYEIEEEIGHGGMATVYRARDTVLDRLVALKIMHPHLRSSEEARLRFHREARSVARLRHPRVLEIYDFSGEGSDEAYIAAELLTGPTLKQWREDHPDVPAEVAACFCIEIAKALEHAHASKIIHRDVKPENVLLHEDRMLKLTDFGIADMVDAASMTATGQILGSPGHMAPEQIEGKDTDTRTDLFSLGTVLYYLSTGRLPFTGRNPHQILKRIVDSEYADPLRVNPTIGGRLRAIIVKSLERDPDDRYQTAAELREDLEAFIAEAGIDNSETLLAKYLKDPDAIGKEIVELALDLLIDRGARASDAGDVPTALDYYNRVLALDDGNERVLRLIERVGLDRRRRSILATGGALMAFGAVAGGFAWYLFALPPDLDPADPTVISNVEEDAGALVTRADGVDAGEGGEDAGTRVARAEVDAGRSIVRPIPRGGSAGIRRVRLSATQQNILVQVDDQPPRRFGAEITMVELRPGPHTFVLIPRPGIEATHRRTTVRVIIPRGGGEHVVNLVIDPRPVPIEVQTNAPNARIVILRGGRRVAEGVPDETIEVPIRRNNETVRIRVSADGFVTRTQSLQLRLGQEGVSVTVELERAPTGMAQNL